MRFLDSAFADLYLSLQKPQKRKRTNIPREQRRLGALKENIML